MAVLMLSVASCQVKSGSGAEVETAKTEELQPSKEDVLNRVQEIYDAVFKEYNREDSLRNLDQMVDDAAYEHLEDFNRAYCSREWNQLCEQINEIDSMYHAGELGFWEADYWIMGQDWHNLSISDAKVLSMKDTEATVEFMLHNFDNAKPVTVQLVNEDGVWKIDNFKDADVELDLKSSMLEYVKAETAKKK